MELTILKETNQPSLQRTAVTARLFFNAATPSRQVVADALAKELGVSRGLVVVDAIYTGFGSTEARVHARVYTDEAVMQRLERDNLLAKNKKQVPEPKEEEPEAPAETSSEPAQEAATTPPAEE